MVVRIQQEGEPRFQMLETIRAYARALLEGSAEAEAVHRRFAAYYVKLAEEAEPAQYRADSMGWLARLHREYANLQEVLEWLESNREGRDGLRLAAALGWYWRRRMLFHEGLEWLDTFLAKADGIRMPERKADAIVMIAEMSYWFHVYSVDSMTKRLQGCAALCREAGYRRGEAMSLAWLGVLLWLPGNRDRMERAAALWEESVGIARETEEPWVIALCLYFASIGRPRNDVDAETLRRRMEEAIALSRKAGDLFGMGFAIHGMGDLEHYQGNHAAAIPWFLESLGIAREADDRMLIMRTLVEMAVAEERCGGYTPATEHLREALLLALKDGAKSWAVVCVEQFGKVAKATGNLRRAARLISAARRLMAALPDAAGAPSDDARTVLEELFGSDGAGLVPDWSQGQAMTEDQAAAYALSGADGEPVAVR